MCPSPPLYVFHAIHPSIHHICHHYSSRLIIIISSPPSETTLALSALGVPLEVLLARGHLHLLGVEPVLQSDHGASLAAREVLPGEGVLLALLRVLVVEGLGDVTLGAGGAEEALVELPRLGAGGDGHVGGGGGGGGGEVDGVVVHGDKVRAAGRLGDREVVHGGREGGAALLGEVLLVVELAVEVGRVLDARRRRDEEQLAVDVVLEDVPGGTGLVGLSETLGLEAAGAGVRPEELGTGGGAGATLLDGAGADGDAVDGLEEGLGHALRDEADGAEELAELVDGEDAVADEVGLCGGEVGEDEAGAIAEDDALAQVDGLEVLGLSRGGRDRDLLRADEGVDGGGFADVGITDQADLEFAICAC